MTARSGALTTTHSKSSRIAASTERVAFWLAVASVATLPLEFTKQYFPVTWLELSRVLIVAACCVALIAATRQREWPAVSGLVAAALIMVGTTAVSILGGEGPFPFRELFSMIAYLAFALTLAWTIRSRRDLTIVAMAVIGSALLVAAIAVLQQAFDFYLWNDGDLSVLDRRNSTLGDPNVAARVITLGFVAALGLFTALSSRLTGLNYILVGVAIILGIGEALTQSRTIWIMTGVVLIAWLPTAVRHRSTALLIVAFIGAVVATTIAAPLVASRAASLAPSEAGHPGVSEEGMATAWLTDAEPTPVDKLLAAAPLDGVRRYLIRAGVAMWLDKPWFGVGLGGFDEKLVTEYWSYVPNDRRGRPTTLLHTDSVRVLAETGVVGLVGWLVFVAAFVVLGARLLRRSTWARFAGMAILSGFVVIFVGSQLAGRFSNEPYLWLLVGLLIATSTLDAKGHLLAAGVAPADRDSSLSLPPDARHSAAAEMLQRSDEAPGL